MKKLSGILLAAIFIWPCLSFEKGSLLNQPIPLLPNKTLDGKTIDENYYKGHVTIVSFMYIGCPPCMNEISTLNKIHEDFRSNQQVQILCVARQMKQQMIAFNGNNQTLFSKIRNAFGSEAIKYPIQPACNDTTSKMDAGSSAISLKSECGTIEEKYGITTFPTLVYVDKKGIVRKLELGGPGSKGDPSYYEKIKQGVESLLAERND